MTTSSERAGIERVIDLVISELGRARLKFPAGFHSGHEGYAVIQEELDELWDAVKHDQALAAAHEAVQVAAMALRFIDDCVGVEAFFSRSKEVGLL